MTTSKDFLFHATPTDTLTVDILKKNEPIHSYKTFLLKRKRKKSPHCECVFLGRETVRLFLFVCFQQTPSKVMFKKETSICKTP